MRCPRPQTVIPRCCPSAFPASPLSHLAIGHQLGAYFSPDLVNSGRIGFTRTKWVSGIPIDTTGNFGTSGNAKVGITFPNQTYDGFTNQGISGGISDVGTTADLGGLIDNTYSYIDTVTWQRGRHSLSFGVQALRYQNNYPTANNNGYLGTLNYTGNFTANPAVLMRQVMEAQTSC